jgi:U6 snRNA-associated Sm-like protein LSm3
MSSPFEKPLDLLKHSLGEIVFVRTRNHCELRGRLVGYDDHLNMMLSKLTIKKPGQP